jgi:uncharacterized membrane protein YhaH (DUF805 family)
MTNPITLFLSPAGRLSPETFGLAVVVVYAFAFAAQFLPSSTGYWPFTLAQVVLTWSWYGLHAKRLRDAARTTVPAAVIAILCGLAVVIVLVAATMATDRLLGAGALNAGTLPSPSASMLIIILYLVGVSSDAGGTGAVGIMLAGVAAIAAMPVVIAIGFSIWAGTRPSEK